MARHLTVEPEDDFCTLALKDILFGNKLQEETAFGYTCPALESSTTKAREREYSGRKHIRLLRSARHTL